MIKKYIKKLVQVLITFLWWF